MGLQGRPPPGRKLRRGVLWGALGPGGGRWGKGGSPPCARQPRLWALPQEAGWGREDPSGRLVHPESYRKGTGAERGRVQHRVPAARPEAGGGGGGGLRNVGRSCWCTHGGSTCRHICTQAQCGTGQHRLALVREDVRLCSITSGWPAICRVPGSRRTGTRSRRGHPPRLRNFIGIGQTHHPSRSWAPASTGPGHTETHPGARGTRPPSRNRFSNHHTSLRPHGRSQ